MKTPAIALGVDSEILDPTKKLATFQSLVEKRRSGAEPWKTAALMCSITDGLCTAYYLRGDWHEVGRWARESVNATEYYLLGNWREKAVNDKGIVDPAWWFAHGIGWTIELTYGLCWGSVLGFWDKVEQLLTFPIGEVSQDLEGAIPKAYYVGLGKWWKNHNDLNWIKQIEDMRGKTSKDYQLRSQVVESISARNDNRASNSLVKYLEHWVKHYKTSPQRLAKEAAFLYHIARHERLAIDLPDNLLLQIPLLPQQTEV